MRVVVPKIVQGISNIVPSRQLAVGFFSKRNIIVCFSHIALGVVLVVGWGICTHIWGGEVTLGWCGRHRRGETTTSHVHDCTQPSMSPCPQGSNIPLEGTHNSDIITCISTHFGSVPDLCVILLQPWTSPWTVPANISTEIPNSITLTVFFLNRVWPTCHALGHGLCIIGTPQRCSRICTYARCQNGGD